MGCVASKRNINSIHSNVYEVINIDEAGNRLTGGHLEVTETNLILHQKNKSPTVWPLKSLRRYGADSELFSFESGRRAPTGEGVYAFRCTRAEQLFNRLQAVFEENAPQFAIPRTPDTNEAGGYLEPSHPRVVIRHNQWNANRRTDSIHSTGPLSPPPLSPPLSTPPPIPPMPINGIQATPASAADLGAAAQTLEENSEVASAAVTAAAAAAAAACDDDSNNNQHLYINDDVIEAVKLSSTKEDLLETMPTASYMNVDVYNCGSLSSTFSSEAVSSIVIPESFVPDNNSDIQRDHVYMNVVPGLENILAAEKVVPPPGVSILAKPVPGVALPFRLPFGESPRCTPHRQPPASLVLNPNCCEQNHDEEGTPPCYSNINEIDRDGMSSLASHAVNYAVLDLDQQPASPAASLTPTTQPESPFASSTTGYVTIDFNKTEALSHSVNPNRMDVDREGCRKTRHNSTINDLPPSIDGH